MGVPTRRWAPGAFQHGNKDVDPTRLQFQKHLGPNEEGQNEPWSNVQILGVIDKKKHARFSEFFFRRGFQNRGFVI